MDFDDDFPVTGNALPLHFAVCFNKLKAIDALLEKIENTKEADVNKDPSPQFVVALTIAIEKCDIAAFVRTCDISAH